MHIAESAAGQEFENQRATRFAAFSKAMEGLLGPELHTKYLAFMKQFFEPVSLASSGP
jgi:hypothetical protein